jgi:glycosyltransferase involved in cell wall biosynthesis
MNILIVTQSVDINNPVLGFFHRWIKEFSKRFDKVTVISLEKGEYNLPTNVKVLSLGKESQVKSHKSKAKYVWNFYKYIWQERTNYDLVFVHMNQEYVLLGSFLWKILGKKITMWRNHKMGNFFTNIACYFCNKIFCTSEFSYTAKFKKTVIMPVGIDTDLFVPKMDIAKIPNSILFLGRIAPVKKPEILIKALKSLKEDGLEFIANFYGDALPKDQEYYNSLVKMVDDFGLKNYVVFHKGVSNYETVDIYNSHKIFVNITGDGSLDKTIYEALSCNGIVVTSNTMLKKDIRPEYFINNVNESNIAEVLKSTLLNPVVFGEGARGYVIQQHSLAFLLDKYREAISNI